VQEIAATVIWLVALNSAALPLATSANDTRIFCPKPSKLELALILTNTTFGVLCSLLGPSWFDAQGVSLPPSAMGLSMEAVFACVRLPGLVRDCSSECQESLWLV